jgi:hypothetical protein
VHPQRLEQILPAAQCTYTTQQMQRMCRC